MHLLPCCAVLPEAATMSAILDSFKPQPPAANFVSYMSISAQASDLDTNVEIGAADKYLTWTLYAGQQATSCQHQACITYVQCS